MSSPEGQEQKASAAAAVATSASTAGPAEISNVSLRLPPFYSNDPAMWFCQVENLFITRRITSQQTKYAYIIASLQPEVAQEIRDLLLRPPTEDCYDVLKAELIRRTSESEQKRLRQLLTTEELGDRKPSQLLRRMQQLLGENKLDENLFKQLFVQRLPTNAQLVVAPSLDKLDLEGLANIADKILEVSPSPAPPPTTVAAVSLPKPPPSHQHTDDTDDLRRLVSQLSLQVAKLSEKVTELSERRSRSPQRRTYPNPRRRSRSSSRGICWYHNRFFDRAHRCISPCSYTSNKSSSSQSTNKPNSDNPDGPKDQASN